MTPKIDKEKCIGCGTCAALAGKTFGMADDGKAEVINESGDSADEIKMAAESCPTQAIAVE